MCGRPLPASEGQMRFPTTSRSKLPQLQLFEEMTSTSKRTTLTTVSIATSSRMTKTMMFLSGAMETKKKL